MFDISIKFVCGQKVEFACTRGVNAHKLAQQGATLVCCRFYFSINIVLLSVLLDHHKDDVYLYFRANSLELITIGSYPVKCSLGFRQ